MRRWFLKRAPVPRISVVAPQILAGDGISKGVRDMIRAVTGAGWQVSVFTRANEFGDIRAHVVNSANELSQHEKFRCADVIIYHFGYFDELFEIVRRGNGRAVQIIVFHNVTPSEFHCRGIQARRPALFRADSAVSPRRPALASHANKRQGADPSGAGR